jgi:hypothetical protein
VKRTCGARSLASSVQTKSKLQNNSRNAHCFGLDFSTKFQHVVVIANRSDYLLMIVTDDLRAWRLHATECLHLEAS